MSQLENSFLHSPIRIRLCFCPNKLWNKLDTVKPIIAKFAVYRRNKKKNIEELWKIKNTNQQSFFSEQPRQESGITDADHVGGVNEAAICQRRLPVSILLYVLNLSLNYVYSPKHFLGQWDTFKKYFSTGA